ncbi:MAG: Glycogen synthase [Verrucomicrobia subdivision 3 bacterium]|nr:Glycogen synthase [Limisphaerales bacterium]MCS1414414.1 Glycogen synthase [Limisphaerales bacterium]
MLVQIKSRFGGVASVESRRVCMRFLMLNWRDPGNPLSGGAERVSLGYLSALARRGHVVYWYANGFEGGDSSAVYDGVRVVRGGGIGVSILRARRWLRSQQRFDLVIDQHHGIPWFAPWWAGTTTVAYVHEVLGPIWNSFYSWPVAMIGCWQEALMLRLYRAIPFWTACRSTEDLLRRHGVRRITRIPYGVATKVVDPLPDKRMTEPLRLVVVSRLAPNKRIDHAIEAIEVLRRRGVAAELTIVGGGEAEGVLKARVSRSRLGDVVSFAGTLSEEEKDALLTSSHLLLHTSVREGWGLNVVEANCKGTPAVVYPVPGLVDSTLHERTGIVALREDPEALADGVQRMAAEPTLYDSCRSAAWHRSVSFHWDQVLPAACDWLESLAGKGG